MSERERERESNGCNASYTHNEKEKELPNPRSVVFAPKAAAAAAAKGEISNEKVCWGKERLLLLLLERVLLKRPSLFPLFSLYFKTRQSHSVDYSSVVAVVRASKLQQQLQLRSLDAVSTLHAQEYIMEREKERAANDNIESAREKERGEEKKEELKQTMHECKSSSSSVSLRASFADWKAQAKAQALSPLLVEELMILRREREREPEVVVVSSALFQRFGSPSRSRARRAASCSTARQMVTI